MSTAINTFTMSEGEKLPTFHKKFCCNPYHLQELLKNMNHVDTKLWDDNDTYRVQGWIRLQDLPEKIPTELLTNCVKNVSDNGSDFILEIWNMQVTIELPF